MKFDNYFKEIKIRNIIFMFLIIFIISMVLGIVFSDIDINKFSLFAEVLLVCMMSFKIRPLKKDIKILYEDFKGNINMKEIVWIIFFITCLEIGSSNILIDIAYMISPSFANWFINNSDMVINSISDYCIVFIIMVILGPFTEEIIFRHVLFKRISKKTNIYIGLIVSSIIFSSINFGSSMIGLFLLGIVNCMLYVKYENILIPMLIYFIDSVIGMGIFILSGKISNKATVLNSNDMILYAVSGVILFTIGMIFFIKFISENKVYLRESFDKSKGMEMI